MCFLIRVAMCRRMSQCQNYGLRRTMHLHHFPPDGGVLVLQVDLHRLDEVLRDVRDLPRGRLAQGCDAAAALLCGGGWDLGSATDRWCCSGDGPWAMCRWALLVTWPVGAVRGQKKSKIKNQKLKIKKFKIKNQKIKNQKSKTKNPFFSNYLGPRGELKESPGRFQYTRHANGLARPLPLAVPE